MNPLRNIITEANTCIKDENLDEAETILKKSFEIYWDLESEYSKESAIINSYLHIIFSKKKDFEQAVHYGIHALALFKLTDNTSSYLDEHQKIFQSYEKFVSQKVPDSQKAPEIKNDFSREIEESLKILKQNKLVLEKLIQNGFSYEEVKGFYVTYGSEVFKSFLRNLENREYLDKILGEKVYDNKKFQSLIERFQYLDLDHFYTYVEHIISDSQNNHESRIWKELLEYDKTSDEEEILGQSFNLKFQDKWVPGNSIHRELARISELFEGNFHQKHKRKFLSQRYDALEKVAELRKEKLATKKLYKEDLKKDKDTQDLRQKTFDDIDDKVYQFFEKEINSEYHQIEQELQFAVASITYVINDNVFSQFIKGKNQFADEDNYICSVKQIKELFQDFKIDNADLIILDIHEKYSICIDCYNELQKLTEKGFVVRVSFNIINKYFKTYQNNEKFFQIPIERIEENDYISKYWDIRVIFPYKGSKYNDEIRKKIEEVDKYIKSLVEGYYFIDLSPEKKEEEKEEIKYGGGSLNDSLMSEEEVIFNLKMINHDENLYISDKILNITNVLEEINNWNGITEEYRALYSMYCEGNVNHLLALKIKKVGLHFIIEIFEPLSYEASLQFSHQIKELQEKLSIFLGVSRVVYKGVQNDFYDGTCATLCLFELMDEENISEQETYHIDIIKEEYFVIDVKLRSQAEYYSHTGVVFDTLRNAHDNGIVFLSENELNHSDLIYHEISSLF